MTPDQGQRGPGLRVLVVDDDADTAATIAVLVGMSMHKAQVVSDGPAALQAAEADPPDVVLLDIGLPGMDGWEVARQLRKSKKGQRPLIIAITGRADETDREKSAEVGIDLHLVKPVDPELLLRLLKRPDALKSPIWPSSPSNRDLPTNPRKLPGSDRLTSWRG